MGQGRTELKQSEGITPPKGLWNEGSQPIVYKVIRLSLPCHKKLIYVELLMQKAHQTNMRHSDVIEEILDNWVSSET